MARCQLSPCFAHLPVALCTCLNPVSTPASANATIHAPPLQQRCRLVMVCEDKMISPLNASKSENSTYMHMKMLSLITKAVFSFIQKTMMRATMKMTTELHDENGSLVHDKGPRLAHDGDYCMARTAAKHMMRHGKDCSCSFQGDSSFEPASSRDNDKDNQARSKYIHLEALIYECDKAPMALPTKHLSANSVVHSMHMVLPWVL
ncbi:hypothetical protein BDQ12DRAFT_661777 [Crucibulum laeve]|uniref:Uncharacterized protein n=1 Tax=Crucibulum laeve TaxID=68775 RepID=A0A5C3MC56_9AGAR|nr:hypothetical protein BDQ12DRAFT_661777 [Crucibulum laeve]